MVEITPAAEIIDGFIKSPPEVYVIHQDYLKAVLDLPTSDVRPSLLIGKRLFAEKKYRERASVKGYVIFTLDR